MESIKTWWVGSLVAVAACSSGGTGSTGGAANEGVPRPPTSVVVSSGDSQVEITFAEGTGADTTTLFWMQGTEIVPTMVEAIPGVQSPFVLPGLTNGTPYAFTLISVNDKGDSIPTAVYVAVPSSSGTTAYDPPWANVAPQEVITFEYDSSKSTQANGDELEDVLEGLQPGQKLLIGEGTYTVNPKITLNVTGTAQAPVWIEPKPGEQVHITRDDQNQNTINIGEGFPTRYLALRNIEITWGDTVIRMYDCENVWIDGCHIHHFGGGGITANAEDTDSIYITRNEIHDSGNINEGEGMYLGANGGARIMTNSIIALNHVYNTGGKQGDGIELKQGSYGNWIVENLVHDNNYPSILVYGTDGMQPYNVIERNVCYNSGDNVMQVQGEAIVRNNLLVNGGHAFFSNDHQGTSKNLTVVHNTMVNTGPAANLSDWNNRPGMVFANNVCYSKNSTGLRFNGSSGTTVTGNVVVGGVSGAPSSGYVMGDGLSDFQGLEWSATALDATPSAGSAISAEGDQAWWLPEDLLGVERVLPVDPGCRDAD